MEKAVYFPLLLVGFAAIVTLCYVFLLFRKVSRMPINNQKVVEIQGYIHGGAMTFLIREYKVIIPFVFGIGILLAALGFIPTMQGEEGIGWQSAICFVIGACFSALAGWIGMSIATKANGRTAVKAQEEGMSGALKVAFGGGAVLGLSVAGFGLLGLIAIFLVTYQMTNDLNAPVQILTGYSLGCSLIALFARVGGGIYTKAADVGADLVGKLEAGIPEDDPRNPAAIADNVGDNVGDTAGMGSDLTESYVGAIISCLTMSLFSGLSVRHLMFPLLICGIGALASVFSVIFVRARNWKNPRRALNLATYIATALVVIASVLMSIFYLGEYKYMFCVIVGLISGIGIGFVAEYYTSDEYSAVKEIAKESQTGHATNIISGLGVGLRSTWMTVVCLGVAITLAYFFGGNYGIALSAVGMLCTVGITVSVDGYGPIADNAGGIAQMSQLPQEVRNITDRLDAVGNTTAAIGKGFSIGSATLTALAFVVSYAESIKLHVPNFHIALSDPVVLVGLLLGAMLPYLFAAMTISAVGRAANKMAQEVRAQFDSDPGILAGTSVPNYNRCIDISTRASLREMVAPGLLAIITPIASGFILGAEGLGGLLIGGLVSSIMLAVFMANSGGAWDNAKKFIEAGNLDGKHSDTHKATITGDTVGDPLKDTAGPAMNILIKLMSVISLILVPVLLKVPSLWDLLVKFFENI